MQLPEEFATRHHYSANTNPDNVVRKLFEKKFHFNSSKVVPLVLPKADILFSATEKYSIDSLQSLKANLNNVKSKLNDFRIEQWSENTRRRNLAGNVVWTLKNEEVKAEFVTNGWSKFFEILNQYEIVKSPKFNSFHLCEAPGAFIAALNHYLHTNYNDIEWKWLSTTLNPYYEGNDLGKTVVDDRFIFHTLENWVFGSDFTGNIMNRENVEHMAKRAKSYGNVDLISADGSIDCTEMPENQEEVVSALHYAEACAALKMLSPGGCFVIKMFTLFEASSVDLLYFMNCIFEDVHVFKPATSKSGNSEVYVICLNLNRDTTNFEDCLEAMFQQLENNDRNLMFPKEAIPPYFIEEMFNCAEFFMKLQINVIEANIRYYLHSSQNELSKIKRLRYQVSRYYVNFYKAQRIAEELKILYNRNATITYAKSIRIHVGSYTERLLINIMRDEEKKAILVKELIDIEARILNCDNQTPTQVEVTSLSNKHFSLTTGKQITRIRSSLFVNMHIFRLMLKIPSCFSQNSTITNELESSFSQNEIISTKISIIDFFALDNYNKMEKEFFARIINQMIECKPNAIAFNSVPFLTHFAISVLFYLESHVFQETQLIDSETISLNKLCDSGIESLEHLRNEIVNSPRYEHIQNFIDIRQLHRHRLKLAVEQCNTNICLHYCKNLLGIL